MSKSPISTALEGAWAQHIPMSVTFELLHSCNLKCVHCYNFDRSKPITANNSMSTEKVLTVIDELAMAGTLFLSFTGGEVLIHPDLITFVKRARSNNMVVRLKTNAVGLSEKRANKLKAAGVADMEISLYGATAETHDKFTRVAGSFKKTVDGTKAAIAAGILPIWSFVLHHGCVDEVAAMIKMAEDLGVEFQISTELTGRYDGTEDSLDHRLTMDDLFQLYSGPVKDYFVGEPNTGDNIQCGCARVSCGIGHTGTVFPCIGAPIPSGDLNKQSFIDIWQSSEEFQKIRGLETKDFKDCHKCELRPHCQRSSGAIYTNTGNFTGKEQWTCDQAQLKMQMTPRDTVR